MLASMPNWALALLIKPLVALAFIALTYALVWVVGRAMPPSRLKTFLFKRRG